MSEKPAIIKDSERGNIWRQVFIAICRLPAVWILGLPLLLLIPSIGLFPYPALNSSFSDLTITHYPNAIFLREAIANWHEIPLWSSTIMSGYPFAANPLSGMWYPPGWLVLILPLPLGFNLLIGLHLIWGGIGLYRLMREEGLEQAAALMAGLAFALLPKIFAHYGAGHLTLLYAVPWTPWLLLSQRVLVKNSRWFKVPPGAVLALIFLADVRWGAYATVVWWAYSAFHSQWNWRVLIKELFKQTALALLLAAPLLLPLIEFSALSTRSDLAAGDVLAHSIPVLNLLGLLFPNSGTNHEWVLYSGAIVALLALAGLLLSGALRNKYYWGFLSLASILVALGSQLPASEMIAALPLVSWLRVPSRALFLTGLGIAALAGYGIDAIYQKSTSQQVRILGLTLFGTVGFALLLLVGFSWYFGEIPNGMLWGTVGMVISAVWIGVGIKSKVPMTIWIGGVFLIAVIDLVMVDLNSFVGRKAEQVLSEREQVAQYIALRGGDTRTYSPSYSIPQQTAVRYGIRMADGVDPLQIADYVRFMDEATGVPRYGYSVTLPPFANGEPKVDNESYSPDAVQLGLLNVGYVVSDFQLEVDGLIPEQKVGDVYIYKNERQRFPAWVQSGVDSIREEIRPAIITQRTANRIQLSASGPGTLVVSEILYPGWQVRIDGELSEFFVQNGTLMGVDLKPGSHEVDLRFRPLSVTIGLILFGLGIILLVWNFKSASKRTIGG